MVQSLNEIAQRPERFFHVYVADVGDDWVEIVDINDHMDYCTKLYIKSVSSGGRLFVALNQEEVFSSALSGSLRPLLALENEEQVFTGIKLRNKITARGDGLALAVMCWGY